MFEKSASLREAYGDVLVELGHQISELVVLDADLSNSTKTDKFASIFKERHFNMGVAEQNMMGTAAGFALGGNLPVVSTFSVFASMRSAEQVRTSIAYPNLNVKIVTTHSGLSNGTTGATHFSEQDIAVMRSIPNMTVIAPSDAVQAKALIEQAIKIIGPVYIRLNRNNTPIVYNENTKFQIGKGHQLREGNHLTIISTGVMLGRALQVSDELKNLNINARVIDMHTVKPLDEELVDNAAAETGFIITMEDHNIIGGVGSAVCEYVSQQNPVKVKRFGIPDVFCGVASTEELWDQCGMSIDNIVKIAHELYSENKTNQHLNLDA